MSALHDAVQRARASGLRLALFALVCATLLAAVEALTRDTLRDYAEASRRATLAQVLPAGSFDNDVLADSVALSEADTALLGLRPPAVAHRARRSGQFSGWVVESVAANGYAGAIRMLVGVDANGVISGVRVIEHRETPGLGDYIDAARSPWSQQFIGRRISDGLRWQVKKDGGPFDAMAGATISARAVTAAVGRAANVLARLPAEHSEGKQP